MSRPSTRIAFGFAVLLVNSAYLAAFAEPSLFYFANVVLHIALGIALSIAAGRYLLVRRPPLSSVNWSAAALLGVAALAGIVLVISGATRPYRWILYTHIGSALAGSLLVAVGVFASARRSADPQTRRLARSSGR